MWNTFFLLIPVVSTTFASLGNMFRGLEKESLGWLFVDEAGQAVPQAALGAIWRCKRAVVIGDPLQIKPVVTVPGNLFKYIREEYGLRDEIFDIGHSVQTFTDNINPWGGFIKDKWVGCPLRVHRRCDEPMFSISNITTYDNLMIKATELKGSRTDTKSRFINSVGKATEKQWVPEHGSEALEIVKQFQEENRKKKDLNPEKADLKLFIIAPFREVAAKFMEVLKGELDEDDFKTLQANIGTIHTFQGKEADIVIFITGCDKDQVGAAKWASEEPNLLNVAVTRAKKTFIAIGDRDLWSSMDNFMVMIQLLDGLKNNDE